MKKALFILSLTSLCAFADPVDCFHEALNLSSLMRTPTAAATLCSGATSNTPIQCFQAAMNISGMNYIPAAATLCSGATSFEPINCFLKAKATHSGVFILMDAAILCKERP